MTEIRFFCCFSCFFCHTSCVVSPAPPASLPYRFFPCILTSSLVAQGFDGIEFGGAEGGVDAEDHADADTDA